MKTCTRCKKDKPESKYNKRRASADGVEHQCKSCKSKHRSPSPRCANEGCNSKRIRYQDFCRRCTGGSEAHCDFADCNNLRKKGRRICEDHFRSERKRKRTDTVRNTKTCSTRGCHSRTINECCKNCTRDQKLEILKTTFKDCRECKLTKALIDFGARAASDDGRCATCRNCSYERHKTAHARRKEKEADVSYATVVTRDYMARHETLGFACSHLLSSPIRNEIPPEFRGKSNG